MAQGPWQPFASPVRPRTWIACRTPIARGWDHRRAADGDERQGDPGHGRDADRHPDVDEDLEQEGEDDACRRRSAERSRRPSRPAAPARPQAGREQDTAAPGSRAARPTRRRRSRSRAPAGSRVRLGRLDYAAPVEAPEPTAVIDCGRVRLPCRVGVGVMKPGQPRRLVGLEHLGPGRRQAPEDPEHEGRAKDGQDRDVDPPRPRDEEDRAESRNVDERGARSGWRKTSSRRREPRARPSRDVRSSPTAANRRRGTPRARGRRVLPELGRLKLEQADVDPALRAASLPRRRRRRSSSR